MKSADNFFDKHRRRVDRIDTDTKPDVADKKVACRVDIDLVDDRRSGHRGRS